MKRFHSLFSCAVLGLAFFMVACGEETADEIAQAIQEKQYSSAVDAISNQLEKDPGNVGLNVLNVQARLGLCIEQNCFADEKNRQLLDAIPTSLGLIPQNPVTLGEKRRVDIQTILADAAPQVLALPNQPGPLLTMAELLEGQSAQQAYISALFHFLAQRLLALEEEKTLALLAQLIDQKIFTEPQRQFLGLIQASVMGNTPRLRSHGIAIRSRQESLSLPPRAFSTLPLSFYLYQRTTTTQRATTELVTNFPAWLDDLGWTKLINTAAASSMADMVATMRQTPAFMKDALANSAGLRPVQKPEEPGTLEETAEISPATIVQPLATPDVREGTPTEEKDLSDPRRVVNLYLRRLELILTPEREKLWQNFLLDARTYTLATRDMNLLTGMPRADTLPASVRKTYNNQLITAMEGLTEQGISILPLLSQIVLAEEEKTTRVRLEKVIQAGLEQALEQDDLYAVIDYTQFNPEIAKQKRQEVVPAVLDALKQSFRDDAFEDVTTLGQYLAEDLDIEFNLDAVLLQGFDDYLRGEKIAENLAADTPDILLKKQEEVQLDLGPKFNFIRTYFKNKPDVVDGILKNLILAAKGKYGTASALYQVYHLFDDTSFPPEERSAYLASTIRNSIGRDDELAPADAAQIGYQLYTLHQGLDLGFVIDETLNRVGTLEEGRTVWQSAPEELKKTLKTLRPEFSALMEGVDTFEKNQYAQAAASLAKIRTPYYLQQAQPYIDYYLETMKDFHGIYVPEDLTTTLLPLAAIAVVPQTQEENVAQLITRVRLGLISRVGTLEVQQPRQLSASYGQTFHTIIRGELDFNTLTLTPQVDEKKALQLPAGFTKVFGDITNLKMEKEGKKTLLIATTAAGEKVRFIQTSQNPSEPLFPDGRYSISSQTGSYILPPGSLIDITTDMERPIQPKRKGRLLGAVYPVAGRLYHPGQPATPQEIIGFYNPTKHTTSLSFSYPLPQNQGTVKAVARCNILNGQLVCGTHNHHNTREKYKTIVTGTQTLESRVEAISRIEALKEIMKIPEAVIMEAQEDHAETLLPPPDGLEEEMKEAPLPPPTTNLSPTTVQENPPETRE
jgi:hypothetical protein